MKVEEKAKKFKWLIMIYAVANDYNSEKGMKDFFRELNQIGKEIDRKGDKAKIKIVLQAFRGWGRSRGKKISYAKRFEIKNKFLTKGKVGTDIVFRNVGDTNVLRDFMVWSKDNYDSDNYLLLLWGHGTGGGMFEIELTKEPSRLIYPRSFKMTNRKGTQLALNVLKEVSGSHYDQEHKLTEITIAYTKDHSQEPKPIYRKVINNSRRMPHEKGGVAPQTTIYYLDITSRNRNKLYELLHQRTKPDALTAKEICQCLYNTNKTSTAYKELDLLVVFGCAMQMFEFGHEIRNTCKYYIASEELMFWKGYNYKKSFIDLLNQPNKEVGEFAHAIVEDTKSAYGKRDGKDLSVSCVDLDEAKKISELINKISGKLVTNSEKFKDKIDKARLLCNHFGESNYLDSFIDIIYFFQKLQEQLADVQNKYTRELYKEIRNLIRLIEKHYIVNKLIGDHKKPDYTVSKLMLGRKINSRHLKKLIKSRNIRERAVKTSIGAQGVSIYFPLSEKVHESNEKQGFFFKRNSEYKVEFVKNKWVSMVNKYMSRNKKLRSYSII